MKEKKEADLKNVGENNSRLKRTIVHRFIQKSLRTPSRVIFESPTENPDPSCIPEKNIKEFIRVYENHCIENYYKNRIAYLPLAAEKVIELKDYSSYDSVLQAIEKLGKPASEFVKIMEETIQPILCIDESVVIQTTLLIHARVFSILTKKHWKDLPDGYEELLKYDSHFDDLCSSLRIGRRTRAIINMKKNNNQINNINDKANEI